MYVRIWFISLLVCVLKNNIADASRHDIYKSYAVYKVWVQNEEQSFLLSLLEDEEDLDVWQHWALDRAGRIMVHEERASYFKEALDKGGLRYELDVPKVSSLLDEEDAELNRYRRTRTKRMVFEDYPRHDEVNSYLEDLAARHPDIVTLVTAGPSHDGRDIKYVKLSTSNFTDETKPVYFLDAMIHAREWVTTPTTLYALHRLLDEPGDIERSLLEDLDWIILPVVNPDGYEYSHTDERLWRRTRSENRFLNTTCLGVDGNRNFDVKFNTTGVSQNPCSQTYPGGEPFSEPETGYVRDILQEFISRLYFYMNIHSHGNYVLYAYGDGSQPANPSRLHLVGAAMGAAMDTHKLPEAGFYLVGNSAYMLSGTSGSAQDYAEHVGVPLAYTLELPGLGSAFQVPPQYIDHINRETWAGFVQAARLTKMLYDADERYN